MASKSRVPVRLRIVQGAVSAFSEYGVEDTTLREIAKRAKVDPPLLKYHFPNMKSLMLEVVHFLLEDLRQYSLTHASKSKEKPFQALESYCLMTLRWAHQRRKYFSLWMYFYHKASQDPDFEEINNSIREVGRDRISLMIFSALEAGEIQVPVARVRDLALSVQSMITGITIVYGTEGKTNVSKAEEAMKLSLNLLLVSN